MLFRLTLVFSLGVLLPSPALAMRASPAGSPGPAGGVYAGRSSQDHPMSLRLRPDGSRLRSVFVRVDAGACSSSPTRSYGVPLHMTSHLVALRANGSFAHTLHFRPHTQAGDQADFKVVLKGRLSRTRASGRFVYSDLSAMQVGTSSIAVTRARCTGRFAAVRFTAARPIPTPQSRSGATARASSSRAFSSI